MDTLAEGGGFRADPRYGGLPASRDARKEEQAEYQRIANEAFSRGFDEGRAAATSEAEAREACESAARAKLGDTLTRIGIDDERRLSDRLRAIALALCTETLAPLALDEDALRRRIDACLGLVRDSDGRVLYLHPDDIAFVGDDLRNTIAVKPDGTLERGEVRIETPDGGIEDGPETWRKAIAEALQAC